MPELPATIDARVLVSWDGTAAFTGPYDNVTSDVRADPGVSIDSGKDGARALDPPKVTACDFSVVNHTGKYSQERSDSPVYQLVLPGRPVKVVGTHGDADMYDKAEPYDAPSYYDGIAEYTLARTVLDDINQSTGWGQQTVGFTTLGIESLLVKTAVTVPVMTNVRVDQAITAILDAVGWPSDRRDISTSDTTLAYWWADARPPWDAIQELLASEGPCSFYMDGDGVIHFEGRNYRTLTERSTTPQASYVDRGFGPPDPYDKAEAYDKPSYYDGRSAGLFFTALSYEPGFKQIRNRATYTIRSRTTAALGAVWRYGADLVLTSGQSVTLIARPSDPFVSAVSPALTTDYTVSGGTVSVSMAASSGLVAFITITATSGAPTVSGPAATPTSGLQFRAQALTVVGETTVTNSIDASASIAKFSPIPGQDIPIVLDVNGWPEIAYGQAVGVCDAWVARYMIQRPAVTIEVRNVNGAHTAEILKRTVSDRLTLSSLETGVSADVWINSKHVEIKAHCASDIRAVFGCEKVDEISGFGWDAAASLWGVDDTDPLGARWGI